MLSCVFFFKQKTSYEVRMSDCSSDVCSSDLHAPEGDRVVLGPAMRADLVIDMTGAPGARFRVIDTFYRDLEYRLLDLAYADAPLREHVPDTPIRLPDNPLTEPDLAAAERHEVTFGGGMMRDRKRTRLNSSH